MIFYILRNYDAQKLKDDMHNLDDVYDDTAKKVALNAALNIYCIIVERYVNPLITTEPSCCINPIIAV